MCMHVWTHTLTYTHTHTYTHKNRERIMCSIRTIYAPQWYTRSQQISFSRSDLFWPYFLTTWHSQLHNGYWTWDSASYTWVSESDHSLCLPHCLGLFAPWGHGVGEKQGNAWWAESEQEEGGSEFRSWFCYYVIWSETLFGMFWVSGT